MEELGMDRGFADLHTHTIASDGMLTPSGNVRLAQAAGLAAVAITDHDTVSGVAEAVEEGRSIGLEVVPGVEISTSARGQDIHVLGYFIDTLDPLLLDRLEQLREVRKRRNDALIEKLQTCGFELTMDEVIANIGRELKPDESVGRPHIAALLVKRGYVGSLEEAFSDYLGKGGKAYVNAPRIEPAEAIRWIHEAGGSAVLAHPGLYADDELVERIAEAGLDGIEAYHADHSAEDAGRYEQIASRFGLLVTAGSDFHGERDGIVFHSPLGSRKIAMSAVDALREKAASRKHGRDDR
ncbi:phosphatase [Paenibacillus contaminans]|uniref:Phosphatase n=2 Tax=Paenibacillus contaminans TaxID=450362 RepID=A0A329MJD5_9BACL|nr:phosphatase [Paenibacillus contaminans]